MNARHVQLPDAAAFENVLRQHALDVWFPRSLDKEYGGFLCDFDRAWKPCGTHNKLLEFQARQTLFAAEALQMFPHDERLARATRHGFAYLRDVMWDADAGGWFHRLDRAGRPLEAHTKHTHGIAYAIHACVEVWNALHEPHARELACAGFAWVEQCARDAQHGGYFGFLTRAGQPIRAPQDCPWETDVDTIDTPIGLKDLNTHSDLMEAYVRLARDLNESKACARLEELVDIICAKPLMPSGALAYLHTFDWRPIPHLVRFGTQFQTTYRFLMAGELLGKQSEMASRARRMLQYALDFAWDARNGGFFFAGPATLPTRLEGYSLLARGKAWWVQVEGLRALMALVAQAPDGSPFAEKLAAQWDYIQRRLLDARYGGMYVGGVDGIPSWRAKFGVRFARAGVTRKGSEWKDASHDGRAWLAGMKMFQAR